RPGKRFKEVASQVSHSDRGIDVEPEGFSGKKSTASTALFFCITIGKGRKSRFADACNACQCNRSHIRLDQSCVDVLGIVLKFLDGPRISRWRYSQDATIGRLIDSRRLRWCRCALRNMDNDLWCWNCRRRSDRLLRRCCCDREKPLKEADDHTENSENDEQD